MSTTTYHTYEARFTKVAHAVAFVADCARWSPHIAQIVRKSKVVTFTAPADRVFAMDLAEFVGYHGSPPCGPVATLDGYPTPRSY